MIPKKMKDLNYRYQHIIVIPFCGKIVQAESFTVLASSATWSTIVIDEDYSLQKCRQTKQKM